MATDNELVMRIGNSTRVEESQIRQYKWASDKDEHEAFMYSNIINFKRSSNPRGHAHHCVMCGDRKAAIPSQNKDVCKTCDSGYWLVESVQVVVKFCKGKCCSGGELCVFSVIFFQRNEMNRKSSRRLLLISRSISSARCQLSRNNH